MLVKTDVKGNVVGTVEGFTGHLGDLDFKSLGSVALMGLQFT